MIAAFGACKASMRRGACEPARQVIAAFGGNKASIKRGVCEPRMRLELCRPKPQSCILTVAFLFPGPEDEDWVNRLVAKVSRVKCCHAELVFDDQMAFSIFKGENVFFRKRTFANPEYQLLSLFVSQAEYSAAYRFCEQAHTRDVGFTDVGMVAAYAQPCPMVNTRPSYELGYTFCSKIVTEALQAGGVEEVEHLCPCTTTPSTLYCALRESRRLVGHTVPYKCQRMLEVGSVF